jgi:hypothetical protein
MSKGTIALVVQMEEKKPVLVEALSDDFEISLLEGEVQVKKESLEKLYEIREFRMQEEEEFGDYVEALLSAPFVKTNVQKHGLEWLKSKAKIEGYKEKESKAMSVIAYYAFKLFQGDPGRKEFILAGPMSQVKIKIFMLDQEEQHGSDSRFAA